MSDTTNDAPASPPAAVAAELESAAVPATEPPTAAPAPAVQGSELWEGPRWMHDFGPDPIWVETKEQYWALCRKHGVRMKDQQESSTGDGEKGVADLPAELKPVIVPPMTKDEAHVFGAMGAIFKRYGIVESLTCTACFARNRSDGVRIVVSHRRVLVECRCGSAQYVAPRGTTDLVLNTVATTAITENDKTMGTVLTPSGPEFRPTTILHDLEAELLRRYVEALRVRNLEPHWFHRGCWRNNPRNHLDEIPVSIRTNQIVITCKCRTLFWRGARSLEAAAPPPATVH